MPETRCLTAAYRRYLDCLNERRWDALGDFVDDDVVHNDRPLRLSGYRAMLEGDVRTIPDLRFVADRIVAEGDVVACRLIFRCTPERPFLGFAPTGTSITFAEHAFYTFRDRRIVAVSSMLDTRAVAAQMAP
ncbi:ester cyclase [Mycolicibacterium sediminis]|uniref:Ester cyclase n=1 Tax=Mycolicibacterium sediminis TaxID=1286180 RepID=A0A7I7QN97_9MYCO|nr:ester cyclase [Mycolicibacterium sediminis]BBY27745.1 ester cyclase [Mycolicibacterium sediminis]